MTTDASRFIRVAPGDYETADGRFRMIREADVNPPAWTIYEITTDETVIDGAASMRDAVAIFNTTHPERS